MCKTFFNLVVFVSAIWINITASGNSTYRNQYFPPFRQCDLSRIEFKIATLEVFINKKFDNLALSLTDTNKHLAVLEYQTAVNQNGITELRNEIRKLNESLPNKDHQNAAATRHFGILSQKINEISQGTHLFTAALNLLSKDVNALKETMGQLINSSMIAKPFQKEEYSEIVPKELKNCRDIKEQYPPSKTGIYSIKPKSDSKDFMVFCDMDITGGGWLVIQNRFDDSQNFYLDYNQYKMGFGNIAGEFWLGLEKINQLTGNKVNELLIELTDADNVNSSAYYSAFSIGPEDEGYPLKVLGGYEGDAGDSLIYHAGQKFSAKDKDQDSWEEGNCAMSHGGGWWYKTCDTSNLNGLYFPAGTLSDEQIYKGIYWNDYRGPQYSLLRTRIMIRPVD